MNNSSSNSPDLFKIADFGIAAFYFGSSIDDDHEINYVKELIKNYKNNLVLRNKEDIDSSLFKPRLYKLWGHFNNACLVPVDDFNFASRIFQPFSHLVEEKEDDSSFIYQSQTHIIPFIKKECNGSIFDTWEITKEYYYIGIVNLKINEKLLIGNGTEKLYEFIKKINEDIPFPEKNKSVVFFPCFSFGWNELTLYLFSNDLSELNRVVINKVLNQKIECEANKSKLKAIEFSQSAFGYNLEKEVSKNIEPNGVSFNMKLFLKQGCIYEGLKMMQDNFKSWSIKLAVGKGDLAIFNLGITEFFEVFSFLKENIKSHKLENKVLFSKTYTSIIFNPDETSNAPDPVCGSNNDIKKFEHVDITAIYRSLKRQRIANSLRDRIVKLYIKYNHAITDNIMNKYFVSLYSILEKKRDEINKDIILSENNFNIGHYSDLLMRFSEQMEKAFFNRYGSSYDMDEVPDWNIDFSGGYQQLIMAYDYAYKSITQVFGEGGEIKPYSFMYLSSHPGPKSNDYSVRLNTFHLYHPELFANTVVHEATNFLWHKLKMKEFPEAETLNKIDELLGVMNKDSENVEITENKLIRYLFCDYVTLLTVFPNNFDGFQYWLFACILSDSAIYNITGCLDEDIITDILMRFLLITNVCNEFNQSEDQFDNFFKTIPQIFIFWIQKKNELKKMTNELLYDHNIRDGIQIINKIILDEYIKNIIKNKSLKISEIDEKISEYKKNKNDHIKEISNYLKNGEVIPEDIEKHSEDKNSLYHYNVTSLLGALLNCFQHQDNFNQDNPMHRLMAVRTNKHDNCKESIIGDLDISIPQNDILIDEIGGVCILTVNKRRIFFQIRATMILTLWNMSNKYFSEIYRNYLSCEQ